MLTQDVKTLRLLKPIIETGSWYLAAPGVLAVLNLILARVVRVGVEVTVATLQGIIYLC